MGGFTGMDEPEEIELPAPVLALPIQVTPVAPEISFSNGTAVRIGFIVACATWFVLSILVRLSPAFVFIVPPLAGFLAVRFYCSRTNQTLSTLSGARMGWITGVFCFVISLASFTLAVVFIQSQGGWDTVVKQMRSQGQMTPDVEQVITLLQSPSGVAEMLTFALICFFLLTSVLPTLGGALGARLGRRP